MLRKIAFLPLLLLLAVTTACVSDNYRRPPESRPRVSPPPAMTIDVGFFYDSLSPYGDWYFDAEFGWVWTPYDVAIGWRPYTEGRWIYTDYGWTWVSTWDWGWAPFHYGRWQFRHRHGWIWVPGDRWAPAWVAWRYGDGWVGWAPLPPSVRFRAGVGLEYGAGGRLDSSIDLHYWSFVQDRWLTDPRVRVRIVAEPRNATLIRTTRDVTRYAVERDRISVRGVDVDEISRAKGRPVSRYVLRDGDYRDGGGTSAQIRSGEVRVYRPQVRDSAADRTPPGRKRSEAALPRSATPPVVGSENRDGQELENTLRRERAELEKQHNRQSASPPQGLSREELERRQARELAAMKERAARERAVRESRAKASREKSPPSKTTPKRKPRER